MAARFGFCGLDRHRLPLNGDEVRACWEDGAVPIPPDPAMPGLLDLMTVRALGDPLDNRVDIGQPAGESSRRRPASNRTGAGRLWVEVEV